MKRIITATLVALLAGGGYGGYRVYRNYRKAAKAAAAEAQSNDQNPLMAVAALPTADSATGVSAPDSPPPAFPASPPAAPIAPPAASAVDPFAAGRGAATSEATIRGQSYDPTGVPPADETASDTVPPADDDVPTESVVPAAYSSTVDPSEQDAGTEHEPPPARTSRTSRYRRGAAEAADQGFSAGDAGNSPRVLDAGPAARMAAGGEEATSADSEPAPTPRRSRGKPAASRGHVAPDDSRRLRGATPSSDEPLEGSGRPGGRLLEGPQTATLRLEKLAPPEVQVGIEAIFETRVQNIGATAAHDVRIDDIVPQGTRLISTEPAAEQGPGGALAWRLETLAPGEERAFRMVVQPTAEGELGSVARVSYASEASSRTISTRPQLAVEVASPGESLIGEDLILKIRVSNPGTGVAVGVLIEASLPDGLRHDAGRVVESELGDLAPGESRDLELTVGAARAGLATAVVTARGDGDLEASEPAKIRVLAPEIKLALEGSKRRFLEREATYVISVSNPGTAAARDVELAVQLPPGIQFIKADNFGEFDRAERTVRWSLEELPAGETGQVTWSAMPTSSGDQTLLLEATAARGLTAKQEQTIQVDGVAAIKFEVVDVEDPIEVGGETTYEIHIVNQGSKAARKIEIVVLAPEGLRPVDAEGPVRHQLEENRVVFDPLPELAPKADTVYRVRVQAAGAGDQRLTVRLKSEELQEPVTKQESTRVLPTE